TIGFVIAEGVSAWYAFRWTLDTVATIGSFKGPKDTGGQVLIVVLIVLGVGTLFYALITVTEFFVSGHLGDLLQERRNQKMIDSLTDHYLICGFGRVGRQVARDLRAAGARYVVIDENPDNREVAEAQGVGARFIMDSPSEDEVLRAAGIERARAVIACVDSDAENIFITLTARELAADIKIVARAAVEDSEKKLRRAGADRVISPYKSSGTEMARFALHPQVTGVVDVAPEYRMEEIEVTAGCEGEGKSIDDIRGGSVIVALRRPDGTVQVQPAEATVLKRGDVIVAMGTLRTITRLEHLFEPAAAAS
ncbi:MAG: voltage-gated potassium channel, partial [Solirubrobacteraceae bacterium]|nr:voltage-gated potassium channel [Solirubrobacteraceae bacterium]